MLQRLSNTYEPMWLAPLKQALRSFRMLADVGGA